MTLDNVHSSSPDPVLEGALNVLRSPTAPTASYAAAKRIFEEQGVNFDTRTLTLADRTYVLKASGSEGTIAAEALAIISERESPPAAPATWGDLPLRDLTAEESESVQILQGSIESLTEVVNHVRREVDGKSVTHGYESVHHEKADNLIISFSVGRSYAFEPSLFAASLKVNYGIDLDRGVCSVVKEGKTEEILLPMNIDVLLSRDSTDPTAPAERVAVLAEALAFVARQGGKKKEASGSEKASYLIRNFFFQIGRILANIPLFLDRLLFARQERKSFVALLQMLQQHVQDVRQFLTNFPLDSHGTAIRDIQESIEGACNAMSALLEDLEEEKPALMKEDQELLLRKINSSLQDMHKIFVGLNIASLIPIWDDNGHLKVWSGPKF